MYDITRERRIILRMRKIGEVWRTYCRRKIRHNQFIISIMCDTNRKRISTAGLISIQEENMFEKESRKSTNNNLGPYSRNGKKSSSNC